MPAVADVAHLVAGPAGRGVPWVAGGTDLERGVDCKYLAWLALEACGKDVPWHALVGGDDLSDAAMEAFREAQAELWTEVPEPAHLGDLVLSTSEDGPHLSVFIDERARRVLTTSKGTGSRILPCYALQGVTAVLRFHGGRRSDQVVR